MSDNPGKLFGWDETRPISSSQIIFEAKLDVLTALEKNELGTYDQLMVLNTAIYTVLEEVNEQGDWE